MVEAILKVCHFTKGYNQKAMEVRVTLLVCDMPPRPVLHFVALNGSGNWKLGENCCIRKSDHYSVYKLCLMTRFKPRVKQ